MERRQREAIYVRGFVKRGGANFVSQGSRTSPSPSASVDLAHLPLDPFAGSVVASNRARKVIPLVEGSSPSRVISANRRDQASSRISLLPVRLFSGGRRRAFLRRRGLVDDGGQQIGQAPTRIAWAGRKLGHLGEAELRIGKRQSALGVLGRRQERVLLVPVPHLDTAPLEQFEFAVKRPQTDVQVRENRVPGPRGLGQKPDQAMKPCGALQGDVNRGATTSNRGVGHDGQSCSDHVWSAARDRRLRLAATARKQPASVASHPAV
jgi:hypothetical protein